MHNFIKVSNAMPKFRKKLKIKFQRESPDRQKGRQTLFYRTLPTTAGGPKRELSSAKG